jgi:hypothetical protein
VATVNSAKQGIRDLCVWLGCQPSNATTAEVRSLQSLAVMCSVRESFKQEKITLLQDGFRAMRPRRVLGSADFL